MKWMKRIVAIGALWAGAATAFGCSGGAADGEACDKDSACRSGSACLYKMADRCQAMGTCQPLRAEQACAHDSMYCDCDGHSVVVRDCLLPQGYAQVRIGGSALAGPCPSGVVAVGTSCTDRAQCGVSQVCAFPVSAGCAALGTCQPEPEPLMTGCSLDAPRFCGCGPNSGREVITECASPAGTAGEPVSVPRPAAGCSPPETGAT